MLTEFKKPECLVLFEAALKVSLNCSTETNKDCHTYKHKSHTPANEFSLETTFAIKYTNSKNKLAQIKPLQQQDFL